MEDEIRTDFGFTTIGAEDLHDETNTGELERRLEEAETKAEKLYDAIIPLLDNLRQNPDKEYIKWPGRDRAIDLFQSRLDNIMTGED